MHFSSSSGAEEYPQEKGKRGHFTHTSFTTTSQLSKQPCMKRGIVVLLYSLSTCPCRSIISSTGHFIFFKGKVGKAFSLVDFTTMFLPRAGPPHHVPPSCPFHLVLSRLFLFLLSAARHVAIYVVNFTYLPNPLHPLPFLPPLSPLKILCPSARRRKEKDLKEHFFLSLPLGCQPGLLAWLPSRHAIPSSLSSSPHSLFKGYAEWHGMILRQDRIRYTNRQTDTTDMQAIHSFFPCMYIQSEERRGVLKKNTREPI